MAVESIWEEWPVEENLLVLITVLCEEYGNKINACIHTKCACVHTYSILLVLLFMSGILILQQATAKTLLTTSNY